MNKMRPFTSCSMRGKLRNLQRTIEFDNVFSKKLALHHHDVRTCSHAHTKSLQYSCTSPRRLYKSLHKYRMFLYLAIFFGIALSNVIVFGKLQTLPGMLKLVNGRNLFIVYCSIPYIILIVEIILYHCQN